jgi:hypothetical protein
MEGAMPSPENELPGDQFVKDIFNGIADWVGKYRQKFGLGSSGSARPNSKASMINQADQMRGNLIIDRVVSFILSSLIVALPILTLLLIKYPLGSLWSL